MATQEDMEVPLSHLEELRHLLTQAQHPQTIALLERGIQNALSSTTTPVQNGSSDHTTIKPLATTTADKTTASLSKISSYGWDQSDKFVKIYISDLPGLDKLKSEDIKSKFSEKSMDIEILGPSGKNYSLIINDLFNPISPDQSSVKLKSGMVIISLKKVSKEDWKYLTGREKRLKDARELKPSKPDKDEDPGVGLMKLMQKMYDDGDDEMKRTIKKAWHESQEKRMKGEDL